MTPERRCGWLRRRWHARVRRLDRKTLWRPLMQRIANGEVPAKLGLDSWEHFKASPSQAHWHCECASREMLQTLSRKGLFRR